MDSENDEIRNLISFGDSEETGEKTPADKEKTQKIDLNAEAEQEKTRTIPSVADEAEDAESKRVIKPDAEDDAGQTRKIDINADLDDEPDEGESDTADSGGESESLEADGSDDVEVSGDDEAPKGLSGADLDFDYDFDAEDGAISESKTAKIIKRIIIAAAIITAVVLFAITDTGIVGAYKRNFKHNFSKIFGIPETPAVTETTEEVPEAPEENTEKSEQESENDGESVYTETNGEEAEEGAQITDMEVKASVVIPYEYATESDYGEYHGGIVCAATNYLRYINDDGETEWECATSVIDPILETAGDYILIAQKGGTKLCLYDGNRLIYDTDCSDNILAADLSENGDCVLVTTKDLYKGAIAAYNRSGKLIYARSSGGGSVIDASISPSSRNIVVSLLDTDYAVRSTIEIFDITENEPIASVDFEDTILFDVEYFGGTINAFGDNSIVGLKSGGGIIYNLRFEDADINHYAYDSDGNKMLLLDSGNVPSYRIYNVRGRQRGDITQIEMADFLEIRDGRVMYNNEREIFTGRPGGKTLKRYTADMDIRELVMTGRDAFFIVYSNSIELVRM